MNLFKKGKTENKGCPYAVDSYNENCKLRNCDRIEICKKESENNPKPSPDQQSTRGQIIELIGDEKADPNRD